MIMPTICLLYLFCFIDRANIGKPLFFPFFIQQSNKKKPKWF